jgi:excisionase family DNA binding protein
MVDGKPVGRRYAKIRDASDYLSVNPLTIRNLINSGRIHGYRSSARLIRVDLNEIDALMDRENCGGVA